MSGDIGVDAGDPAQRGREQESVMVGEIPLGQLILLLYLDKRGRPKVRIHGRPRSDRREDSSSRLWRPARALGTHAKRGPSTGHSAVGLRQGGEISPDAEATFHRASCTLGNQVFVLRTALLFVRSAVRLVYAELPGAGSGLLAEASTPHPPCRADRCRCRTSCELGDRVLGWRPHR